MVVKTSGRIRTTTGLSPRRVASSGAEVRLHQQGGILTPREVPIAIVVTGEEGQPFGYDDRWADDGVSVTSALDRKACRQAPRRKTARADQRRIPFSFELAAARLSARRLVRHVSVAIL